MPGRKVGDTVRSFRDRSEVERFLLGRVNYEQLSGVPYHERSFKLGRMGRLLDLLGNPEQRLSVVHIAGTKGKGSVSTMVASIATAAGYRTGLFSSPHFERIEERWTVDGAMPDEAELIALGETVRPAVERIDREFPDDRPTYFEIVTAFALLHFERKAVDLAVLEVGLGGRLDSTNVCRPLVSVITSISLDHMDQLGRTLAAIAREKAGIIKPGVPVISGEVGIAEAGEADSPRDTSSRDTSARDVIREVCREQEVELWERDRDFSVSRHPLDPDTDWPGEVIDYRSSAGVSREAVGVAMSGAHQAANAAVALAVIERLTGQGYRFDESAVRRGLASAVCRGRVQFCGRRPRVVFDTAHNRASAEALVQTLEERFPRGAGCRRLLFAISGDKDLRGTLAPLLAYFDRVVFTRFSNNPRGADPNDLLELGQELSGKTAQVISDPKEAWQTVLAAAGPDDLLAVVGSFYLVGELGLENSLK